MVRTYAVPGQQATDRPFATDSDAPPPMGHNPLQTPFGAERQRSNVVFAGPDQVSSADIYAEQQAAMNRKQYAGRTNHSDVELTDEVRWEKRNQPRQNLLPAQQNNLSLCTDLPVDAGRRAPDGQYYDDYGRLRALPEYAARRAHTNITNEMFGGAGSGADAPPPSAAPPGRARAADNAAQRTVISSILYGGEGSGQAEPLQGRRHIRGRASHIYNEGLSWIEEEETGGGRMPPPPRQNAYSEPPSRAAREYDDVLDGFSDRRAPPPPPRAPFEPSLLDPRLGAPRMAPMGSYEPPAAPPPPSVPTALAMGKHQAVMPSAASGGGGSYPMAPPHAAPRVADYASAAARAGAVDPGQLLYDQESRQWVTRDGQPARFDPLLKGGAVVRQPAAAANAPLRFHAAADKQAAAQAAGGMRHPILWTTSNQASYQQQYDPKLHGHPGEHAYGARLPGQGNAANARANFQPSGAYEGGTRFAH